MRSIKIAFIISALLSLPSFIRAQDTNCKTRLTIGGRSDTIAKKLLTFPMGVIVESDITDKCPDGLRITSYTMKYEKNGAMQKIQVYGAALSPEAISTLRRLDQGTVFYVTNVKAKDPNDRQFSLDSWSFVLK